MLCVVHLKETRTSPFQGLRGLGGCPGWVLEKAEGLEKRQERQVSPKRGYLEPDAGVFVRHKVPKISAKTGSFTCE